MNFTFETEYNQKAIKTMAYLMRKTIRKKKNLRSRILGWIAAAIAILLTIPVLKGDVGIKSNTVVTWIAALVIIFTLLFEDAINGYMARRRMLAGTSKAKATFNEDNYISETAVGKTEFGYGNIALIAENKDYFAFILDKRYAQIYDKNNMSGGTIDEFRKFITDKTGKKTKVY